jgi:hypothetical protein
LKSLIKKVLRLYYHQRFKRLVVQAKSPIVLLDIDNTLADTWPSLLSNNLNSKERHKRLKPLTPVIKYIQSYYPSSHYTWVYLTSRKYQLINVTKNWLLNFDMQVNNNVILVQSPKEKIELINQYIKSASIYFDDLSYNQEKGELYFYSKEIEAIRKNNLITYFGYQEIQNILSKNE